MLKKYSDALVCEICGADLYLDRDATVDDYVIYKSMTPINFNDKLDDLINGYLVYVCVDCGRVHKYTYKDLEKKLRLNLTKKSISILIRDLVNSNQTLFDDYFVYCGKCQGFDGKGSCPKSIFDECPIKRFPINELL